MFVLLAINYTIQAKEVVKSSCIGACSETKIKSEKVLTDGHYLGENPNEIIGTVIVNGDGGPGGGGGQGGGGGGGYSFPLRISSQIDSEYIVRAITDAKGKVDADKLAQFLISLEN